MNREIENYFLRGFREIMDSCIRLIDSKYNIKPLNDKIEESLQLHLNHWIQYFDYSWVLEKSDVFKKELDDNLLELKNTEDKEKFIESIVRMFMPLSAAKEKGTVYVKRFNEKAVPYLKKLYPRLRDTAYH